MTSSSAAVGLGLGPASSLGSHASTTIPPPPPIGSNETGQYHISSIINDGATTSLGSNINSGTLLPALSLAQNPYLPSSISSLGTTFTSAGTIPKASATSKSVAQRRSQAPPIVIGGGELRHVHMKEFDAYLKEVAPAFERWQQESRLGRDGTADLSNSPVVTRDDGTFGVTIDDKHAVVINTPRIGREEPLPPLEQVPQIFFDPAFNLSNPRTFDLVTERITSSPPGSPRRTSGYDDAPRAEKPAISTGPATEPIDGLGPLTLADLATDQVLQEKLSHYTAVIESHLVREIGRRSSSFFSALSNLQSLHHQGDMTLAKIAELQTALAPDRSGVGGAAKRGLNVLRAQARRRGLEAIERGVRDVEEMWNGVQAVKELVENGEWIGALEVSEQVEAEYYGTNGGVAEQNGRSRSSTTNEDPTSATPSTPNSKRKHSNSSDTSTRLRYTRVKALDGLPRKLDLLRTQVAKSLETELVTVLNHEMEVGIVDYQRLVAVGRWIRANPSATATAPAPLSGSAVTPLSPAFTSAFGVSLSDSTDEAGEIGQEQMRERAKDRTEPVVTALVRADGMDGAVAAWRENVLKDVRRLVREHLPFSDTNDSPMGEQDDPLALASVRASPAGKLGTSELSDKSATLAKRLRALSHEDFIRLARDTYLGLLGALEVTDVHAHVLNELARASHDNERARRARRHDNSSDGASSPNPPRTSSLTVPGTELESISPKGLSVGRDDQSGSTDEAALYSDITDVVHAVAELANLRFSKVIGVRTEQHARLPLESFVEIFDVSWAFVLRCETICQRMIVGLRGVMVGQAKTFLQTFHQVRLTDSAKYVEEEQWNAADVPASTQHIVNLVIQTATIDPPELLWGQRVVEASSERKDENPSSPSNADATPEAGMAKSAKQVDVEGRKYFAVSAGVLALDVLSDYLKVVINCPLLTTDAMSKVVEFLKVSQVRSKGKYDRSSSILRAIIVCQSYNSRTCQMVLGAGAMRSAGLKNITAKHLALASQALSIMISLVPYIREGLRRHLNPKQAIMLVEFDKVKRDYQEHQNEIHSKLVAIMGDRLEVHAKTLKSLNWAAEDTSNQGANAYMESLVKEHITLHKVLLRFLHTETVVFIMRQVFSALEERLKLEFTAIELANEEGKRRMLGDVAHLRMRFGELKGLEDMVPGKELETLVAAKDVPKQVAPTPKPTPAPAPPPPPAPAPVVEEPAHPPPASTESGEPAVTEPKPEASAAAPTPETPTSTAAAPTLPIDNVTSTPTFTSPRESLDSTRPPVDPASLTSSTTNSPILNRAPPADVPLGNEPPKRKSLAERLAEMARRGSNSATKGGAVKSSPKLGFGLSQLPEVPRKDGKESSDTLTAAQPQPEHAAAVAKEEEKTEAVVQTAVPEVEVKAIEDNAEEKAEAIAEKAPEISKVEQVDSVVPYVGTTREEAQEPTVDETLAPETIVDPIPTTAAFSSQKPSIVDATISTEPGSDQAPVKPQPPTGDVGDSATASTTEITAEVSEPVPEQAGEALTEQKTIAHDAQQPSEPAPEPTVDAEPEPFPSPDDGAPTQEAREVVEETSTAHAPEPAMPEIEDVEDVEEVEESSFL
ncbi:BQ2448_1995 [Microbotryum intermedium]|uniref:BQ2448_1995 protein n=1 Tax=Microbotryum intermedium TaxID=269621 RepID=A0A238F708_9BASI|nr:BQ2448_1995 [Microbotryum intermedium]